MAGVDAEGKGSTMFFSAEDEASVRRIAAVLEDEAAGLPSSSRIADVWRDWSALLTPVVDEATRAQTSP